MNGCILSRSGERTRAISGIQTRPSPLHRCSYTDTDLTGACDGRKLCTLTVTDGFTRECLAIKVARRLNSKDVLEVLAGLMARNSRPVIPLAGAASVSC